MLKATSVTFKTPIVPCIKEKKKSGIAVCQENSTTFDRNIQEMVVTFETHFETQTSPSQSLKQAILSENVK